MYWLKRLTLVATTAVFCEAFASGGQAEKVPPAKPVTYSGVQNDEWSKAQKDLQTAKIKFENDKKALEDLKHSAEMQENLSKESLAKINEATKTMKASEANYLRFLNQYNLRFPEKGLDVGRKYERTDTERDGIETVEEKPQGVEAKLRRLDRNIKHQYLKVVEPKKKPKKKQSSGESSETLPQTPADDVTDKITIEK
ncbi:MAG: hypothetical protein V4654_09300 [Bdellovibrionota bacterium]